MPYIITTTDPQHVCQSTPDRCQVEPVVSRHAVATLEEARIEVERIVTASRESYVVPADARERVMRGEGDYWPTGRMIAAIPESGGTITLPDGTVIEVEPQPDDFDVDAYNEAQS